MPTVDASAWYTNPIVAPPATVIVASTPAATSFAASRARRRSMSAGLSTVSHAFELASGYEHSVLAKRGRRGCLGEVPVPRLVDKGGGLTK
jgi:hypothetical protein